MRSHVSDGNLLLTFATWPPPRLLPPPVQIILLLSCLGVHDGVFEAMQEEMLRVAASAFHDRQVWAVLITCRPLPLTTSLRISSSSCGLNRPVPLANVAPTSRRPLPDLCCLQAALQLLQACTGESPPLLGDGGGSITRAAEALLRAGCSLETEPLIRMVLPCLRHVLLPKP